MDRDFRRVVAAFLAATGWFSRGNPKRIIFGISSVLEELVLGRIWTVTDGKREKPLAYFSQEKDANQYVSILTERYGLGRKLALHGKQLAPDADSWALGFGPVVSEHMLDEQIDRLPGAWLVKVDESCRMIACQFSTHYGPLRHAAHYTAGSRPMCEAYGRTPHMALDNARKAMMSFLAKPHRSWR